MTAEAKADLRARLRKRRCAFHAADPDAALRAADRFDASRLPSFRIAALYRPIGAEIDPGPLGRRLAALGAGLALPVVTLRDAPLTFRRVGPDAELVPDALGILAPGPEAEAVWPDLIVTPLLAFDALGGRVGQGGGFYDRTLASLRSRAQVFGAQVFALGLAYEGQFVDRLETEAHDQPLDGVLTPSGFRMFARG
jgi:5-formyltetrahydrofolate cyclo-ligase